MDNCQIHKSEALREIVESFGMIYFLPCNCITAIHLNLGCNIVFLPPYLPHLNPIEESVSAGNSHKLGDLSEL